MSLEQEGNYVFVSYAHKDEEVVRPILDMMKAAGLRFWYDAGIELGTEWPENIANHLVGASCVIAFVTQNYVNSQSCRDETFLARQINKSLIVAYLESTELPPSMLLLLGVCQGIWIDRFSSCEEFVENVLRAKCFEECFIVQEDCGYDATDSPQNDCNKLLERANQLLKCEEWGRAEKYAKCTLNAKPDNAEAWLAALMAELHAVNLNALRSGFTPFDGHHQYKMASRFGGDEIRLALTAANDTIRERVRGNKFVSDLRATMTAASVGDTIYIGSFPKQRDPNVSDPIEWRILAKTEGGVFLISRFGLDVQAFNGKSANGNDWNACNLKAWLRGEFARRAGLECVADFLTCLSAAEAKESFKTDGDRACEASEYAADRGAWANKDNRCRWWLRTPGDNSCYAMFVRTDGTVCTNGDWVDSPNLAVRPALWLNL